MPFVAFPAIKESAAEWLERHRVERDERRRERLHALWLMASAEGKSRMELARRLGRNRETVSRWLADYARGGLATLLRPARRPGPASRGGTTLPATVQEAIRARLARPRGERGYLGFVAVGARRTRAGLQLLAFSPLGPRPTWGHAQGRPQEPRTKKEEKLAAFRDTGLRESNWRRCRRPTPASGSACGHRTQAASGYIPSNVGG